MYSSKAPRILLSFFLILGIFSSLTLPSVQAENFSSTILSPAIVAKLDAFVEKVKAKRSSSSSDENWGLFIDNLSKKISALKPRYADNLLILAVLDRLNSGVIGLKTQGNTTTSSDSIISSGPIVVASSELAGTYTSVNQLIQKAKSINFANCITVDGGKVYGDMGPCLSIQVKKPIILTQSNPGTLVGNYYHYPVNTHQETLFPELAKGPKSFAPMMNCEIMDLDNINGLKGSQSRYPGNDLSTTSPGVVQGWKDAVASGKPVIATYAGDNLRWVIPEHGCIAVKFTTGSKKAVFSFASEIDPIARPTEVFMNISRNPGDFDYANIDTPSTGRIACGGSGLHYHLWTAIGSTDKIGSGSNFNADNPNLCRLQTGTTYYLNIRSENALLFPEGDRHPNNRGIDSCPTGTVGGCGGLFGLQYYE